MGLTLPALATAAPPRSDPVCILGHLRTLEPHGGHLCLAQQIPDSFNKYLLKADYVQCNQAASPVLSP